MLGLGRPSAIAEHQAEGEVARVYHEIRQVLRVNGVNLVFRRLAAYPSFPAIWDALKPALRSRGFFDGADRVRAASVEAAAGLGRLDALGRVVLGESQAYQVRAALALYHDVNPKLLAMTAAARLSLEGERLGGAGPGPTERVARGIPPRMYPMEMVPEDTDEPKIRAIFDEIRRTFDLPAVNSDYRTLALWPDYLSAVWERLRPIVSSPAYEPAVGSIRERARAEARALPVAVILPRGLVGRSGDDPDAILDLLRTFERLLAPLILNVSLIALDWHEPAELVRPPFPAPAETHTTDRGGA